VDGLDADLRLKDTVFTTKRIAVNEKGQALKVCPFYILVAPISLALN
jgi:hypothetical protein